LLLAHFAGKQLHKYLQGCRSLRQNKPSKVRGNKQIVLGLPGYINVIYSVMGKRIGESTAWFAWLDAIRMVGFLQKLSTIDNVTKYPGIPVSRYF